MVHWSFILVETIYSYYIGNHKFDNFDLTKQKIFLIQRGISKLHMNISINLYICIGNTLNGGEII